VQRWVRDCDAAPDLVRLQLLDRILRVGQDGGQGGTNSNKHDPGRCLQELQGETADTTCTISRASDLPQGMDLGDGLVDGAAEIAPGWAGDGGEIQVERLATWTPEPCTRPQEEEPSQAVQGQPEITAVLSEKAAERQPPNHHDLQIFTCQPDWIRLASPELVTPHVRRHDVPGVPGAFDITGILTRDECRQIIATAEHMGFRPDHPVGKDKATGIDTCEWLADDSILGPIFERARPHMPLELCGGKVAGVNARWRLFRYGEGAVYRPHIDGSWPGSGLRNGKYVQDAYGDRRSRLTFLVYLNQGFTGGPTTFYLPAEKGGLEARGVDPQAGAVLCFPQGNTASLVHEGSVVTAGGCKYVIRTDALYMDALTRKG